MIVQVVEDQVNVGLSPSIGMLRLGRYRFIPRHIPSFPNMPNGNRKDCCLSIRAPSEEVEEPLRPSG